MRGFDLRHQVEPSCPCDLGTRRGLDPVRRMQSVLVRRSHQFVIRGVKTHLVDPVAMAIVGVQDRLILVCSEAEFDELCGAGQLTKGRKLTFRPGGTFTRDGFAQCHVLQVGIVVLECRGLVFDLMGFGKAEVRYTLVSHHGSSSSRTD